MPANRSLCGSTLAVAVACVVSQGSACALAPNDHDEPISTRELALSVDSAAAGSSSVAETTPSVAPDAGPAPISGECQAGPFFALPPNGSRVLPGQRIVYRIDTTVTGASVLGCSRDLLPSPLLEFIAVRPDGWYAPETSVGPMISVEYGGPLAVGTYRGLVITRVRRDAPPGATIESSSLDTIRHVVARRR